MKAIMLAICCLLLPFASANVSANDMGTTPQQHEVTFTIINNFNQPGVGAPYYIKQTTGTGATAPTGCTGMDDPIGGTTVVTISRVDGGYPSYHYNFTVFTSLGGTPGQCGSFDVNSSVDNPKGQIENLSCNQYCGPCALNSTTNTVTIGTH